MARCKGWHNLPSGWFSCGVDATFFHSPKCTGVGIILRNDNGSFVAARILTIPRHLRVGEGEAMGLHEALSWIKDRDMARVVFHSDNKLVVDAINTNVSWIDLSLK